MRRYTSLMIALFATAIAAVVSAQSNSKQYPHFAELSQQDAAQLEQQRQVIAKAAKDHYGTPSLTRTKADLPVLQRLIDDKVFGK